MYAVKISKGLWGPLSIGRMGEGMLNVVLVEPEIPQNCGNIARTCAATGSRLHLVEPLGFDVSERAVRRAGLDYWHLVEVRVWPDLPALLAAHPEAAEDLWLALDFREAHRDRCLRLPMVDEARSLNLSNSVAVLVYEALRQNGFPGLRFTGEMGCDDGPPSAAY